MSDAERWIGLHEAELDDVARRTGAHQDTVHFLATLVLSGWSDEAIYEQLRELIPSPDGQHSPLAQAPIILGEVRQLVGAS